MNPRTPRAQRRADAEQAVSHFGGRPRARQHPADPRHLCAGSRGRHASRSSPEANAGAADVDDVYTITSMPTTWRALWWRRCGRQAAACDNASDYSALKMGDYFDMAADLYGLPRHRGSPGPVRRTSFP